MSKSTGNFMTLDDVVKKYGADAARVALADAGDGISDSNFVEDVADNTILRFYNNKEWIEENIKDEKLRTGPLNDFQDSLFDNEMNGLVNEAKKHYEETSYKLALKAAHYDFLNARDVYREACSAAGIPLHKDLILKYTRLQALILTPIAPHWAEHVWLEILGEKKSIQFAAWPDVPAADPALTAAREYVRTTSSNINSAEAAQLKKMAKGRQSDFDPKKPKKLTVFVTESFPAWQAKYIELLKEVWDAKANKQIVDDKELNGRIGKMGEMKKAMPFVQALKKRLRDGEPADAVLERKLAFDEKKTLLVCFTVSHLFHDNIPAPNPVSRYAIARILTNMSPTGNGPRPEARRRPRVDPGPRRRRGQQARQGPDQRRCRGRDHGPRGRVGDARAAELFL
jgi:leucyl-tRNA synthetase